MTPEEPDLPDARAVKDGLETRASGEPAPANLVPLHGSHAELRGDINVRTVIAGVLVATIMGSAYPYMVLKLGFGPNVSVVAAFFGFLFLRMFDFGGGKHYNRWQNNLAEAAGTSAAQTAFMCVLLGAFDILRYNTKGEFSMELSRLDSFLWLTAACTLGVLLAVPLRRHFIVDEKLPFADGIATAETIIVIDPPKTASATIQHNALAAFRAVMLGVALSALLMVFRDDAKLFHGVIPEGYEPAIVLAGGVVLAKLAVGFSYSLLSIGSGIIIGIRVNWSTLLGGVLAWIVAPSVLVHYGELPFGPKRTQVLFWVMWPATGMLVASGLTALALRWRLLVDTFRSLRGAKVGSTEMPLRVVVGGALVSGVALCVVQRSLLGMPIWMTLLAIAMSVPLMLVGLRVLGETNWGPISALSNMMQGLFAAIAPGNVVANMVASGTTGTIATSSESIMQDYKAGDMIGTKPRNLTIMQLIAVPIGAAAVSLMYPILTEQYGIVGDNAQLTSPVSNKWAGFAALLKQGVSALPTSALVALVVFSVLGVIFTVLESKPKLKMYVPSPTGLGIGILVPFSVVFTMFLGGFAGWIWERTDKKSADVYMIPLASGLIAGEALVAVIVPVLLKLGIGAG